MEMNSPCEEERRQESELLILNISSGVYYMNRPLDVPVNNTKRLTVKHVS